MPHHVDARAISRIAGNPSCDRQAAMLLLGLREDEAFTLLTGKPYSGPRGERTAALRWGTLFDSRLTENHATRLLAALDGVLGINPATATVRDLRREVLGTRPAALAERNRRTRAILADLLAGRSVPDVLIQPPLQLRWSGREWGLLVPDALILDRASAAYLPLEAKGFVSVDGVVAPGDRAPLRLQAATQILALDAELRRLDPGRSLTPRALLVVATAYGFRPAPAHLEDLGAEIRAVAAGLRVMARTASRLELLLRTRTQREAVRVLPSHFQEACLASCALAEHCRRHAPGLTGEVGDEAARALDPTIDLPRVLALLSGDPAHTPQEGELLVALTETAAVLHWREP
jgi:hypothetical protein